MRRDGDIKYELANETVAAADPLMAVWRIREASSISDFRFAYIIMETLILEIRIRQGVKRKLI